MLTTDTLSFEGGVDFASGSVSDLDPVGSGIICRIRILSRFLDPDPERIQNKIID